MYENDTLFLERFLLSFPESMPSMFFKNLGELLQSHGLCQEEIHTAGKSLLLYAC